jgi:hypothetical protein
LSARAKRPELKQWNAMQIKSALLDTVRHFNSRWNERTGFGELDVNAFFRALDAGPEAAPKSTAGCFQADEFDNEHHPTGKGDPTRHEAPQSGDRSPHG